MTVTVPDRKGRRRLSRLLRATENKAFEGTIPYQSDYPDEQEELDAIHASIDYEYDRAMQLMHEHLDAQALMIVDLVERRSPAAQLLEAITALGALPEGYCFCSANRVGDDSKIHEPECADLRAVIAAAEGKA